MTTYKRDDGEQFVFQPYREHLTAKKPSLLKNEIRLLSRQYGQFVYLNKQDDGSVEAVFSHEPGCLLGETAWKALGHPNDLVYYEWLPNRERFLLVIVCQGCVYFDGFVVKEQAQQELAIIYTQDPLLTVASYGTETLDIPDEKIGQRGHLKQSLFLKLNSNEGVVLKPFEVAFKALKKKTNNQWLILGVLIAAAFIGVYAWMTAQKTSGQSAQTVYQDPYRAYELALETPDPEKLCAELAALIGVSYGLPGWQLESIQYQHGQYQLLFNNKGGSQAWLMQWANVHRLDISSVGSKEAAIANTGLLNRPKPTVIYPLAQVNELFAERMKRFFVQPPAASANPQVLGGVKTVQINLTVADLSPTILELLGRGFAGMPIQLSSANLTVTDGAISGTIQLLLLGS